MDSKTFPPFTDEGDEATKMSNFIAWEKGVRNTLIALNAENLLPMPQILAAILASFRERALEKSSRLDVNNYADVNALMQALRALFCGAAIQEKSYNLFMEAKQETTEDINTFHCRVQALWMRAFNDGDRSEADLRRVFLFGLRHRKLREHILLRDAGPPQDYEMLLQVALQIQGRLDTVELLNKGTRPGHLNRGGQLGGGQDQATPMDIGNVNRGKKEVKGRNVNNVDKKNPEKKPPRAHVAKNQCQKCFGFGHWKGECPSKKQNPGGGTVNHVESQNDSVNSPDEEESDWDGCAALSENSPENSNGQE